MAKRCGATRAPNVRNVGTLRAGPFTLSKTYFAPLRGVVPLGAVAGPEAFAREKGFRSEHHNSQNLPNEASSQ